MEQPASDKGRSTLGSSSQALDELADLTRASLARMTLAEAADQARRGDFALAESTLASLPEAERSEGPALDLMARICAQQGQLPEAAELWQKALEKDPANEAYLAGLARARKASRQPGVFGSIWTRAAGIALMLAAALALIGIGALAIGSALHLGSSLRAVETLQARVSQVGDTIASASEAEERRLSSLEQTASDIQSQIATTSQTLAILANSSEPVQPIDAIPGENGPTVLEVLQSSLLAARPGQINVRTEGATLLILFSDGLFRYGTVFSADAPDLIAVVGAVLRQQPSGLGIAVIGYSDPSEQSDQIMGVSIGLLRASKVAQYLQASAQLAPSTIRIELPVDRPAPYPNDSLENRLLNRTVIILVETEGR